LQRSCLYKSDQQWNWNSGPPTNLAMTFRINQTNSGIETIVSIDQLRIYSGINQTNSGIETIAFYGKATGTDMYKSDQQWNWNIYFVLEKIAAIQYKSDQQWNWNQAQALFDF